MKAMAGLFRHKNPFRRKQKKRIGPLSVSLILLCAAIGLLAAAKETMPRRFFLEPTLELPVESVHHYRVVQEDSIPNDTLFQLRSAEGFPLAYYRKIHTNVCFDGTCRMLKVNLYWNITGRYLGIELPPEEFLSKTDHEKFNLSEYARMNALLADSLSPLADFTFEELVYSAEDLLPAGASSGLTPPGLGGLKADAVTSATSPAMADYVVAGAAYTTYRLWHFVYGPTRTEIMRRTEALLSPELLIHILASPDVSDVAWGLQRVPRLQGLSPELEDALLAYIANEDFSLATLAIDAIPAASLESAGLQRALIEKLSGLNYSLKNKIVDKLAEAPTLDSQAKAALVQSLESASGSYIGHVFGLFLQQEVNDAATCRTLSALLHHENHFVAKQAFDFLEKAGCDDESVLQQMNRYRLERAQ